jgi:AAA family ATP:ADP antiporter
MFGKFGKFISFYLQKYLQIDEHDKTKLVYLAFSFLFIIGAYSILRPLKTSVFLAFVGRDYLPKAKIVSIFMLFPVMLCYSKLIDKVRRYQVAVSVLFLYAVIGIGFALIFLHPVYGVKNTQTNPYRLLGWFFEFFMDFFQALIVSSFWSFVTSVSTPEFANKTYGIIVGVSRVGGVLSTAAGFLMLSFAPMAESQSIPLLTFLASILLLVAGLCVYQIIRKVPKESLRGYEAAYQASKQKKIEQQKNKPSVLEGLLLMVKEPYVMGIFGLVCCFELINIIFDYKMEVLMSIQTHNDIGAMSKFMLLYTGAFQLLGCILALIGTTAFLNFVGMRVSVLVMPVASIILGILLYARPTLYVVFVVMVIIRALQYGFNMPIREALYIPTIKDIQFKSKAWIDSFGRTIAKSSGSTVNLFMGGGVQGLIGLSVILSVSAIWLVAAFLVGRKYVVTIKNNEVIGS